MKNILDTNIVFSVKLNKGSKNKSLADFVVNLTSESGIAMNLNCTHEVEVFYLISALRDCADACETELNRPESQLIKDEKIKH